MIKELIVVTIPAYNEEKTIGRIIDEIRKVMDENKFNYKILVVNDGSRDKTAEIAKEKNAVVVSNSINLGLAETFKVEMKKCLELNDGISLANDQFLHSN